MNDIAIGEQHCDALADAASAGGDRSPSVVVVLPAFNEEVTISDTIRAFHDELPSATYVVVDNNSSDRTAARARETLDTLRANGCVVADWIPYRYIYHVPLAILAAAFELSALACLGIGLVMDAINHQFRMLFERGRLARREAR